MDLGGGANGHLGIILDAVEYDKVAVGCPYIRHSMPDIPIFASNTPQHEVARRRDDFKEAKRLFKEMISLEKALIQQLRNAIPSMYLKRFRSKNSNAIDKPISFILNHLFYTASLFSPVWPVVSLQGWAAASNSNQI